VTEEKLKLEVGKKYKSIKNEVVEILFNVKSIFPNFPHDFTYYGINTITSHVNCYNQSGKFWNDPDIHPFDLIEEHVELYQNTVTGWIGYSPSENFDNALSCVLLQSCASPFIFENKKDVRDNWKKAMHVKITIEEIPE
jgi:hypothetical protein